MVNPLWTLPGNRVMWPCNLTLCLHEALHLRGPRKVLITDAGAGGGGGDGVPILFPCTQPTPHQPLLDVHYTTHTSLSLFHLFKFHTPRCVSMETAGGGRPSWERVGLGVQYTGPTYTCINMTRKPLSRSLGGGGNPDPLIYVSGSWVPHYHPFLASPVHVMKGQNGHNFNVFAIDLCNNRSINIIILICLANT